LKNAYPQMLGFTDDPILQLDVEANYVRFGSVGHLDVVFRNLTNVALKNLKEDLIAFDLPK